MRVMRRSGRAVKRGYTTRRHTPNGGCRTWSACRFAWRSWVPSCTSLFPSGPALSLRRIFRAWDTCTHMSTIFTHDSAKGGRFGAGMVPEHMRLRLAELADAFNASVPEDARRTASTYHIWKRDMNVEMARLVSSLAQDPVWGGVCGSLTAGDGAGRCVVRNIDDMDELYFSRAPLSRNRGVLYGATSNYDLHVDGCFRFPGIRVYRVLIGLSDGNTEVETVFPSVPAWDARQMLNKNGFIIFDFDRTPHVVVNHAIKDTGKYRTMLKLHFCACHICDGSSTRYLDAVTSAYVTFERITRYVMQTGTDPETLYEFLLGFLCFSYITCPYVYATFGAGVLAYLSLLACGGGSGKRISSQLSRCRTVLARILVDAVLVFLLLVALLWVSFKVTGSL